MSAPHSRPASSTKHSAHLARTPTARQRNPSRRRSTMIAITSTPAVSVQTPTTICPMMTSSSGSASSSSSTALDKAVTQGSASNTSPKTPSSNFTIANLIDSSCHAKPSAGLSTCLAKCSAGRSNPTAVPDTSCGLLNFNAPDLVESHAQTQKKYRPKNFRCPACKMAFSNNGQLKNHVRIHTGERPFICSFDSCNKTFTRNEELTRHKLIHTGVRPHSCHDCGKRFGRKDHLKKHLKTHERKRIKHRSAGSNKIPPRAASQYVQSINASPPKSLATPRHPTTIVPFVTPPQSSLPSTCLPSTLPSMTETLTSSHIPVTSTAAAAAVTLVHQAASSAAAQALANDYWHRWYSLFGLYNQPSRLQAPLSSSRIPQLEDLFREQHLRRP